MRLDEKFVSLCGQIGNLTEAMTGVHLVDAYSGPDLLAPQRQPKDREPTDLIHDLDSLLDEVREELRPALRSKSIEGEINSLRVVLRWLTDSDFPYDEAVKGMFHVEMKRFPESELNKVTQELEDALHGFPGEDLREKVQLFRNEGNVTGEALKDIIHGELQEKTRDVAKLFKDRIYKKLGVSVTDNGVEYKTVRNQPWGGYNYYQGDYKSINEFNIDRNFNANTLLSTIYHEYEHHVSNLWREHAYRENDWVDLSCVPLHTGRCVISEGTADTAREFLEIADDSPTMKIWNLLYVLGRMTSINVAIILNQEKGSIEDAVEYQVERAFRERDRAKASLDFIRPKQENGKVNFWSPYIFTYFLGRTDFVYPTFEKAKEQDLLSDFFKTIYLNPYSCTSLTWNEAFEWL